MAESEIRFVGSLRRLRLRPGDRFVLNIDRVIPWEAARRIQDAWAAFAGPDPKLLILEPGMRLGAINVSVTTEPTPPAAASA